MARLTRTTTPIAPSRALRSSLGAGTRTDIGPGSRASARARNVGEVAAREDAANQEPQAQGPQAQGNKGADLETMREEQAQIRL